MNLVKFLLRQFRKKRGEFRGLREPEGFIAPTGACYGRGATRAAGRRWKDRRTTGWRAAHAASAPYRQRIVDAIEAAKKLRLGGQTA